MGEPVILRLKRQGLINAGVIERLRIAQLGAELALTRRAGQFLLTGDVRSAYVTIINEILGENNAC